MNQHSLESFAINPKLVDYTVSPLKLPYTPFEHPTEAFSLYRGLAFIDTPVKKYEDSIFCRLLDDITPRPIRVENTAPHCSNDDSSSCGFEGSEDNHSLPTYSPYLQKRPQSQEQRDFRKGSLLTASFGLIPISSEVKSGKTCTCKKSKCQKKYCECYKAGGVCGKDCECVDCQNTVQNAGRRLRKLRKIASLVEEKYDDSQDGSKIVERVACNCKKSGCVKNYCECHSAGQMCSDKCNCLQCKNKIQATAESSSESQKMSPDQQVLKMRAQKIVSLSLMKTQKKKRKGVRIEDIQSGLQEYF